MLGKVIVRIRKVKVGYWIGGLLVLIGVSFILASWFSGSWQVLVLIPIIFLVGILFILATALDLT